MFYLKLHPRKTPVSRCRMLAQLHPHGRSLALKPRGRCAFRGVGHGCGGPELGRTVEEWKRVRAGPECRLEDHPFHPVMWLSSSVRRGSWGGTLRDLMERTVVRCAEGHVFSTASFPMQQAERLSPRSIGPVSAVCAAPERRSGHAREAVGLSSRTSGRTWARGPCEMPTVPGVSSGRASLRQGHPGRDRRRSGAHRPVRRIHGAALEHRRAARPLLPGVRESPLSTHRPLRRAGR